MLYQAAGFNLSSTTGTSVSRQTVYKRLQYVSLYARRPAVCISLTSGQKRARLQGSLKIVSELDNRGSILCSVTSSDFPYKVILGLQRSRKNVEHAFTQETSGKDMVPRLREL
ncbi:hypothetical protein AVEN_257848-1 [Araneus ventricosus]|uniref:Transposase Tc1-like domain-containing protein n=1 Tax=Araneus ventricosus TaxID=182803 RepID=A0A4Y2EI55_ARAVE|nr:hypothetical protein AVEN_257848-1 [Araneus ventricosus]